MTEGAWWPTQEFVAAAAKRVNIAAAITVFPDAAIYPEAAAQYRGLAHRIALYPGLTEHDGIVAVCHELIHVAQAEQLGPKGWAQWVAAEEARVGNKRDGAHELQAYPKGEELAAAYLPPGHKFTYRKDNPK